MDSDRYHPGVGVKTAEQSGVVEGSARARRDALRRDPGAARIARQWRTLTRGAPTVGACSGGADSTALVLALWAARAPLTIAHVVHDLRPREEALADRDAVRTTAGRLGVPLREAEVCASGRGNAEGAARGGRYRALAQVARECGCRYVATGHHAGDVLETMLMAIARGAGPRGLAGPAPARAIADGITLVRPMLGVGRADAERICALAGVEPRHDSTNDDRSRLRAAVRTGAARELLDARPGAACGAARAAGLLRDAAGLVADRAGEVFGEGFDWARESLRRERAIIVGEGLRLGAARLTGGAGLDRLTQGVLAPAVRAIRDGSGAVRRFDWPSGLLLTVGPERVRLERLGDRSPNEKPGEEARRACMGRGLEAPDQLGE